MARHPQSDQTVVQLSELLAQPGSELGGLLERSRLLQRLQSSLAAVVDPALADRFQVANIREGRLILIAPSAVWATRLRLHSAKFVELLRRAGLTDLEEIEVRVAPLAEHPVPARPAKQLSPAAEQALELMTRLGARKES